jgi:thiosulfate/3-mercaptopyruvate sulfurtransferase
MDRSALLITPAELASRLDSDAPPVIADCRFALTDPGAGERAWAEAHLPGAHYLHLDRDLAAPRAALGGRHPLPDAASFAARMRAIGLSAGRLLVAYDDSRGAFAARLWWLARYFGHEAVRVLDGGWGAWRAAGLPVSAERSSATKGNFTARPDPRRFLDYEALQRRRALGDVQLVDSRDPARYAGSEETIDPVAGHIPGACNLPWGSATDADGRFLDAEAQRRRWAGLRDGRALVVYCGSGVTACVNLLSLALAGHEDALLYPGSWSDWCARSDAPVARGADPG